MSLAFSLETTRAVPSKAAPKAPDEFRALKWVWFQGPLRGPGSSLQGLGAYIGGVMSLGDCHKSLPEYHANQKSLHLLARLRFWS